MRGDDGGLLFVDLGQGDENAGRLVVAAAGGLMQGEGLDGPGEGKEEQGRR